MTSSISFIRRIVSLNVACACRAGTEGTSACNAGRLCAKLSVDGQDVGNILIGENLAERYVRRDNVSAAPQLVYL